MRFTLVIGRIATALLLGTTSLAAPTAEAENHIITEMATRDEAHVNQLAKRSFLSSCTSCHVTASWGLTCVCDTKPGSPKKNLKSTFDFGNKCLGNNNGRLYFTELLVYDMNYI
jgi:hypothetical protein